jgi:DNA-binding transcriptional LysR family regulator
MHPTALEEALDENTTPERLCQLLDLRDNEIDRAIAQNPNTPTNIILRLIYTHPLETINNPAIPLLGLEKPELLKTLFLQALRYFIKKSQTLYENGF